jgi:uncharacterized membrane protein YuzA (DUF378 family)
MNTVSIPTFRVASRPSATLGQVILLLAIVGGMTFGLMATGNGDTAQAVTGAGADLTRLLRAMAAIKAVMAIAAGAAIAWRLRDPAPLPILAAYAAACAAMAAGPGLIWGMVHVGAGALLLHGGLAAALVLLWRDPAVGRRLAIRVAARRRSRAPV